MTGKDVWIKIDEIKLESVNNNKRPWFNSGKFCEQYRIMAETGHVNMKELLRTIYRYMITVQDPKYRRSYKALCKEIKKQIPPLEGLPFRGGIEMRMRIETYKDIDNIIKMVCDTLEEIGIIENDRNILRIVVDKKRRKRGESDRMEIKISSLEEIK